MPWYSIGRTNFSWLGRLNFKAPKSARKKAPRVFRRIFRRPKKKAKHVNNEKIPPKLDEKYYRSPSSEVQHDLPLPNEGNRIADAAEISPLASDLMDNPSNLIESIQIEANLGEVSYNENVPEVMASSHRTNAPPQTVELAAQDTTKANTTQLTVECAVCRDDIAANDFPKRSPSSTCSHPPDVCSTCVELSIQATIRSGDFLLGVLCPSSSCSERLGFLDVERCTSRGTFERYVETLKR
jgi:hypothetical protein